MGDSFKYRAFISYSHADQKWAAWLHKSLETYRIPRHLVGRVTAFGPIPERLAPVFRDRDELASATNLGEKLTLALQQSAAQIVICSPAAARSRWVNEEILTFKRLGREDRVFCLIIAGEPGASAQPGTAADECFPNALIYRMGADGQLSELRSEPIAADARPGKDGRNDAKLKLIAGLLDVSLDELKQREAQRRHRRMMLLVAASVAGMAITSTLAGAAWMARNEAERQRVRAEAEAETARQTTRFMVDLFKVSDPSEALGNSITAREILDKGAGRIGAELAEQPVIQATLMDTMGTVYTGLGLYEPAVRLLRQAYVKRERTLGGDHPDVARSLNHLGEVLTLKADFEEAEKYLNLALERRRRVHGPDSTEVADTLMVLAELMYETGRYTEGEPLIREALRIRRQRYGPKHPDVAASIEALGLNYLDRGEVDKAEPSLRLALSMRRELHPVDQPLLLAQAMGNLAWALQGLDKYEEAEKLQRESLALRRRIQGEAHPEVAVDINNLAFTLQTRGAYREAESLYRESLAMNIKLLGADHPDVAFNENNLAWLLYRRGDLSGAIRLMRRVLESRRRSLGAEHPDVAGAAANLALWLTDEGQFDAATALVEESLVIRTRALGAEHPQVAGSLTVKANLMLATGRYAEAIDVAREAERILRIALPADHWQVAAAVNVEGAARARLGEFETAEKLLLASLEGLAGSALPGIEARGRQRLAEIYTGWRRPAEAAKYRVTPASTSAAR
jgi:tetratricopeptide (TPR) repeat protein